MSEIVNFIFIFLYEFWYITIYIIFIICLIFYENSKHFEKEELLFFKNLIIFIIVFFLFYIIYIKFLLNDEMFDIFILCVITYLSIVFYLIFLMSIFIIFIVSFYAWFLDDKFHVDEPIFKNLYIFIYGETYKIKSNEEFVYFYKKIFNKLKYFWFNYMCRLKIVNVIFMFIVRLCKFFYNEIYIAYIDKSKKKQ